MYRQYVKALGCRASKSSNDRNTTDSEKRTLVGTAGHLVPQTTPKAPALPPTSSDAGEEKTSRMPGSDQQLGPYGQTVKTHIRLSLEKKSNQGLHYGILIVKKSRSVEEFNTTFLGPPDSIDSKLQPQEDDFEWQPPSEAELKIIQARRERSDKISKLMGDYLLKGYKMLGITCTECGTILLQDREGENYCIACRELDTDTSKDDPVVSTEAARSQILEGTTADVEDNDFSYMIRQPEVTHQVTTTQNSSPAVVSIPTVTSSGVSSQLGAGLDSVDFSEPVDVLCQKITWATAELKKTNSVEYCIHLCQLIKASADSIQSLKNLT